MVMLCLLKYEDKYVHTGYVDTFGDPEGKNISVIGGGTISKEDLKYHLTKMDGESFVIRKIMEEL